MDLSPLHLGRLLRTISIPRMGEHRARSTMKRPRRGPLGRKPCQTRCKNRLGTPCLKIGVSATVDTSQAS